MTAFDFLTLVQLGDMSCIEWYPFRVHLFDETINDYAKRMFGARIYSGTMMPGQNLVAIWDKELVDESCLVAKLIDDFDQIIYVYRLD